MQTINFYLDSYKPKPLSFDSRFALLTIILSLIGLIFYGWIQASEVEELKLRLAEKDKQSAKQLEQLNVIKKTLGTESVVADLQAKLINSQTELASYNKIVSTFNMPLTGKSVKFSEILNDLSKQTVDYLWLTKITIAAQNLSLNGATTKAESIPTYVDKLKQSTSLNRYFDELRIEREIKEGKKLNKIINFELINGKLSMDKLFNDVEIN